jgi:hypothetical protein
VRVLAALGLLAAVGCSGSTDGSAASALPSLSSGPGGTMTAPAPPPPVANVAPGVVELDARAYSAYPDELLEVVRPGYPSNAAGLIGRNAEWGALYSPRFQMGSGGALRIAVASGNAELAARAFEAVRAGAIVIDASGRVPSSLPADRFPGAVLSAGDVASGAAFFLGDACLGMLALRDSPAFATAIAADRRAEVVAALVRGARWLATQVAVLTRADAAAPNRLLFDARAFAACGALAGDALLAGESDAFVRLALLQLEPAGYFREGGGWDTSYQAVAIQVGRDVLAAGARGDAAELAAALQRAADWLAARVRDDGRVDSAGNTRTCDGGESFLGVRKSLALTTVFAALAYEGVVRDRADWRAAAQRVANWARANPGVDPCGP